MKWVTIFQWNHIVCHIRNYFCSYPTTLFVSHSASVLPDCTDFHKSCCCSGCDAWVLFSSLALGSNLWNAVTRPASPPLALDCFTVSDRDRWWLWCSGVWHLDDGDGGGVHLQHYKHTTLMAETRDVSLWSIWNTFQKQSCVKKVALPKCLIKRKPYRCMAAVIQLHIFLILVPDRKVQSVSQPSHVCSHRKSPMYSQ